MPVIAEKICVLRSKITGNAPPLTLLGPALKFSVTIEPFVSKSPIYHYQKTYPVWCSYYSVPPNNRVSYWLYYLENYKVRDLDLNTAPGFETLSDSVICLGPYLMSLTHDQYFKSLIVRDIDRKEIVEEMAEVIRNNRTLTKIVLSNVNGDQNGFMELGNSLNENTSDTIQIIDFSNNKVGVGMDSINLAFSRYKNPITFLNLSDCNLQPKQLMDLFAALTSNQILSKSVEYLNLASNKFDDESSSSLSTWGQKHASKSNLQFLSLSNTGFNFNSLIHIKSLPVIRELDISNNRIETPLQLHNLLHFLDINKTISLLNLSNTSFGLIPKDSGEILNLLWGKHETTRELDINLSNNISIGPLLTTYLVDAINLKKLDISGVSIRESQLTDIVNILSEYSTLSTLKLDNILSIKPASEEIGICLAQMTNLKELQMTSGFGKVAVISFLETLKANESLTSLDISWNQIGDLGAEKLSELILVNETLKIIKFDGNNTGLNGWNAIGLSLYYNKILDYLYWPSHDILELQSKLDRRRKDILWKILMKVYDRLQKHEPKSHGYKFWYEDYPNETPPTPGLDLVYELENEPKYEAIAIVTDETVQFENSAIFVEDSQASQISISESPIVTPRKYIKPMSRSTTVNVEKKSRGERSTKKGRKTESHTQKPSGALKKSSTFNVIQETVDEDSISKQSGKHDVIMEEDEQPKQREKEQEEIKTNVEKIETPKQEKELKMKREKKEELTEEKIESKQREKEKLKKSRQVSNQQSEDHTYEFVNPFLVQSLKLPNEDDFI